MGVVLLLSAAEESKGLGLGIHLQCGGWSFLGWTGCNLSWKFFLAFWSPP